MPPANSQFVHLRNHTQYSLSEGAIKIYELVELAAKNNMPAVAITDSGNLFGILEFSKAASSKGVQPIIGCEVKIEGSKLILYAANQEGFQNLLKLVSHSLLNSSSPHEASLDLVELEQYTKGLLCLTGGIEGEVAKLISKGEIKKAHLLAERLSHMFPGRLYIEISRHGLEEEEKVESQLIDIAYKYALPLIATNNCFYADRDMFEAHDALICIAEGKYISDENRKKYNEEFYFKSTEEMRKLFADLPEAVNNTVQFAKRCSVKAEGRKPLLPDYPSEGGLSQEDELRAQAKEGLKHRLEIKTANEGEGNFDEYWQRLDFELDVIIKMKFPGYFLIVSDFIKWAKNNHIPVGPGRGSGAGSIVAWALQITDVDPIRFGLLFERFLNPERVSMPDFDIDFCQERREEVIEYVRNKYGHDRVAQIITFGKLQARAVLRDVGRVMQIPYMEIDRISKMIPFNPVDPVTLSKAIEMDPELRRLQRDDENIGRLLDVALRLEGLNRHASTHAAGILIGDRPLVELIPLYKDPRSEMPVSQYSMKDAETAGLVKFDFLGLRTLTLVDKALHFVEEAGAVVDIHNLKLDDEKVFHMLAKGETAGVFQLDTTLVKDAIRKMRPDKFEDIVALTSLCRPGPMENIPTYNARKHGKEEVEYPHISLSELLGETYGIMVYQEQVMQSAQVLAGYSLGKADLLRRAMGKKIKAEMDEQRSMFSEGAAANGIGKKLAGEIFDLIAKFAGYGFNKSHAVAYSVIAYQTAYLSCHYPVEFLTACMNLDIGDTDKLSFYKHEITKRGIKILPPDINESDAYFKPENGSIRYALGAIKGVGIEATKLMVEERRKNGKFKDVFDFAKRCSTKVVNKKHLEGLAKAGAFDSIASNRRQIFDSAELLSKYNNHCQQEVDSSQISLFGGTTIAESPKPALYQSSDWDSNERLNAEYEAFGFYLSDHPLNDYQKILDEIGVIPSVFIEERVKSASMKVKLAGVIATLKLRSGKKGRFGFAKISDAYGGYEIVLYDDDIITRAATSLENNTPIMITAEAKKDEGGVRLIAERIEELEASIKQNFQRFIKVQDINFAVDNLEAIQKLKAILADNLFESGMLFKNRITLHAITKESQVTIELPGFYAVNDNVKEQILFIEGIKIA